MQQKKTPMRRCVGCNESKPKKELVRIVRSPEGEISLDPTGKKSGRGAYVCRNRACIAEAQKRGRLEKAFSCRIDPAVYEQLAAGVETEGADG